MKKQQKKSAPGNAVWIPFYSQKNKATASLYRQEQEKIVRWSWLWEMLGGMAVLLSVIFWAQGYF